MANCEHCAELRMQDALDRLLDRVKAKFPVDVASIKVGWKRVETYHFSGEETDEYEYTPVPEVEIIFTDGAKLRRV